MITGWPELQRSVRRSIARGVPVTFWWRDDDAVAPTAALERLNNLAEKYSLPVHIAVVPAHATQPLAEQIAQTDRLIPVVHGWRHANHALEGVKKSEFGTPRAGAAHEIAKAHQRLQVLFGDRLLPLFVPPWNRFDTTYMEDLAACRYRAISTFGPRTAARPHPNILQLNAHIDPIDWRGSRDLMPVDALLGHVIEILERRASGDLDAAEPLGYLTHHLVHSDAIWSFSERLLGEILDAGAVAQAVKPLLESPT